MKIPSHAFFLFGLLSAGGIAPTRGEPLTLKNQRELFVDDYLVAATSGVEFRLGKPVPADIAMHYNESWEGRYAGGYVTVIHDRQRYRMYYRGSTKGNTDPADDDWRAEITCYAESSDGIHWKKPHLGLYEVNGTRNNNVILPPDNPYIPSDNFAVLYDDRPGVPPGERFKAIGGQTHEKDIKVTKIPGGLYRYVSADGIHWKLYSKTPICSNNVLGSLNVLSWIPTENNYAIYLRSWTGGINIAGENKGLQTIARTVSKDFEHWSEPRNMSFGGAPGEHLYTNATEPYFRAPQILISLPMRFLPDRRILSEEQLRQAASLSAILEGCFRYAVHDVSGRRFLRPKIPGSVCPARARRWQLGGPEQHAGLGGGADWRDRNVILYDPRPSHPQQPFGASYASSGWLRITARRL